MSKRSPLPSVRSLFAAALGASALPCLPVPSTAQQVLAVGDSLVAPGRLPRGSERFEMVLVRDGQERPLGTYEVRIEEAGGLLLITQSTVTPQGTIADTAWVDPVTFVPRRQVSRGPGGDSDLRFAGARVTGTRRQPDGGESSVDETSSAPVYSASIAQLLVRTLPLREGLHLRLPLYQDPGGATDGEIEVLETEGAALRVRLRIGAQAATVWIDPGTRREVRTEAEMGGARLIVRPAARQEPATPRILLQDPSLDNLATPAGMATAPPGTLGGVTRRGAGPGRMLLIPGLGFGADVFDPLVDSLSAGYTTWAVTLAGFGGTPPPPAPPAGTSFGEQTWTNGALAAIEALLVDEGLTDVVVVGHWLTGTQLALRLALRQPARVRAVVLLTGSARTVFPQGDPPLDRRIAFVDGSLAPQWFRTVTRETWDDNNFLPADYAAHPVLGLRYWRAAARPHLHTWVRYLCEFHAQDVTRELGDLKTPALLLQPGFEGLWHDPGNDYMTRFTTGSWGDLTATSIRTGTVPGARAIPWADQPARVLSELRAFLAGLPPSRGPASRPGLPAGLAGA